MTRVIAGVARGRRLATPAGTGTRPTSDRAREAFFSTVEALRGGWDGARVLDLYAGSGAIGLEALSRGAVAAVLVESEPQALTALRANVRALALPGAVVRAQAVERTVATGSPEEYDVVFADPPYVLGPNALADVLRDAQDNGWLARDAVVVVERASRGEPWSWPDGVTALQSRRYGEATLWYGRAAGPSPAPPTEE